MTNEELKQTDQIQSLENTMTDMEFAMLGDGSVSYIRKLTSEQATELFPFVSGVPKDAEVFALHSANGTPLALADSHGAAIAQAMEDDLITVSVH